jgi:pyruvate kinase
MVARGDLGVEIGDAALIAVQKHLIARCRQLNRLVITATQMMESMIENPMPTRAEVFDVANAVLDGTDAVMLSGESAAGKYPVEAVASMAEVCLGAEKQAGKERSNHRIDSDFETVDETIAISAMFAANHLKGASAIVSLTESGRTARIISRISSKLPIYAVSVNPDTLARCALYRGVIPVSIKLKDKVPVTLQVLEHLHALGHINPEDKVVLTRGSERGHIGGSDTVRITSLERIKG